VNAAIAVLGGLVLLAAGLALREGVLVAGLRAGGVDLVKLLPLLVLCFALAGLVQVLLPAATVSAWLSDDAGWRGIAVAWVAGAATPGGGPIGLSLAAGLQKSGAGIGVVVTYLTSLSLLSFVRVPLEVAICGGRVAALRYAVCAILPPIAGVLAQAVTRVR
jgi:uncharacterized membrane protein YraQ (UPF0718 family)